MEKKKILVTGGFGFIGSAVVRHILSHTEHDVGVIDKLTYAADLSNIVWQGNKRVKCWFYDLADKELIDKVVKEFSPDYVMHLAAESHVDNSIADPSPFIVSNIVGTYNLLESCKHFAKDLIKFHHISTDEVYGDLASRGNNSLFTEGDPYHPSSPYSASKASSDHLVEAWVRTYKFPAVITNCSNNYGQYHHPEKLIPKTIIALLTGKKIPIHGDGEQIRDWLYVEDHAKALYEVVTRGEVGEAYNIGGNSQRTNLQVVKEIMKCLTALGVKYDKNSIKHVEDRQGGDAHYGINCEKIDKELGVTPSVTFEDGVMETVKWYVNNKQWWENKI